MADNIVEITVRSKNDTRAGFDAAKADAELAGEEAGQGFMNKFGNELASGGGGAGGGPPGGLLGFGAVAAGAILVSPLIAGIVNGLVAATAGIGALGLVAIPTFEKIKNAYTAVGTAQTAYNTAVEKEKIAPTKANATAVATALTNLKVAQEQAGPGTLKIVDQIHQLGKSFDAIGQSMQPQLLGIFNTALGIAAQLMPVVATFAKAAAPAVEKVMTSLSKSISSQGFKDFVSQFSKISGPAIVAIGHGLGGLGVQLGKLLTVMSAHDVVHALNIAFDLLSAALQLISGVVSRVMSNWDRMSGAFERAKTAVEDFTKRAGTDLANWAQVFDNIVGNVNNWFNVTLPTAIATGIHWFQQLPGKILSAIGNLGGLLVGVGKAIIGGLISGIESALGPLGSVLHSVTSFISSHKGPLDADAQLLVPHGQAIMGGLMRGIGSRVPALGAQLGGITSMIGGYGAAGAGHGGVGVTLEIAGSGNAAFDAFMLQYIRHTVRIKGGGSVQQAFGKAGM